MKEINKVTTAAEAVARVAGKIPADLQAIEGACERLEENCNQLSTALKYERYRKESR